MGLGIKGEKEPARKAILKVEAGVSGPMLQVTELYGQEEVRVLRWEGGESGKGEVKGNRSKRGKQLPEGRNREEQRCGHYRQGL